MALIDPSVESYRRTSDTWLAVALWAAGFPIVSAELEDNGRTVSFLFADSGEVLAQAVQDHSRGQLMVSSIAMREGYSQLREWIREVQAS